MRAMSKPYSATCTAAMADALLPSLHQLRSAHQAARVLHFPKTSLIDARQSFRSIPSDGVFGSRDFEIGGALLHRLGLVSVDSETVHVSESIKEIAALSSDVAPCLLLDLVLERLAPSWLAIAAGHDELRLRAIPEKDLATISMVVDDPGLREAMLLRAGRRHNAAALAALGNAGEEHVVERCRAELLAAGAEEQARQVSQVSLISDQLGYDVVAPRLDGSSRRLEVKTTRKVRWRGEVFVSRNEFEVGLKDPDWALVVVEIDSNQNATVAGWCRATRLDLIVPGDRHAHGRWVSASLQEAIALLEPDLPAH